MKAAVISLGSKSSKMTIDSMKKYFNIVDDINLRNIEVTLESGELVILYEGNPLADYDCIYAKGSFRYATMLRALTSQLSKNTYMPLKPDSFTLGHDKILTHISMLQQKIPQPKTYLISSLEAAKDILNNIKYPIIFKFPQGTQGKGVMFAESVPAARMLIDALDTLKQPFLIQEYVDTGGIDIRAFVVGDRVVASMRRKAEVGDARANIHAGGKGEPIQVDFITNNIAVKAAEAIGAEICAVDMLSTPRGHIVIEVNVSPGLQGITSTTKVDVADKIAKFLFDKSKERIEHGKKEKEIKVMHEIDSSLNSTPKQIITNLDFRGERILLPKLVTDITKIKESDEIVISATKGSFSVKSYRKKK